MYMLVLCVRVQLTAETAVLHAARSDMAADTHTYTHTQTDGINLL